MAGNTWLSGEGAPQKPKEQAAARGHQLLCRSAGRDELSSQRRINARFFAQGYTGFHRKRGARPLAKKTEQEYSRDRLSREA